MDYQLLEWDSREFGFKVGKIILDSSEFNKIDFTLNEMKEEDYKLIYYSCKASLPQKILNKWHGRLVDKKVTYLADLALERYDFIHKVGPFRDRKYEREMEDLAIQSGEYSRFHQDPYFPPKLFENIYKQWIKKSINKEIANEVMVIEGQKKIEGMITLGERNGRGDIGLVAVEKNSRGKGIGKALVMSAKKWFYDKGHRKSQVITQLDNIAACKLYEKCGYEIEKMEYYYHFGLDQNSSI